MFSVKYRKLYAYCAIHVMFFFFNLQLIKQIPNLSEKNRERPLCYTYSIKARALLHAHLNHMTLNPNTLDKDRQYIVKKCPYLIQEMVNCVSHLILLAYARRSKCSLNYKWRF
jgi:translocation protein SEC63